MYRHSGTSSPEKEGMGGKRERVIERKEGKEVKRTNAVFILWQNRATGKKHARARQVAKN